ncbi:putative lipoprotein with Yx(FWY)xxD motif [Streptacidiphilus sp. MAP12-33]|uniref:COG4315 family predicted lipoprotein n=1 Tax=Streptacidiphilus sp. MAP12-33 TaxID=3156266 RepID=UPI00351450F2
MNRLLAVPAIAVAVAAVAVGCSSSTKNAVTTPASATGSASASTPASTAALHTANSKYGQILVDSSGHTLYLLTADSGSKSTCYGTCATFWPPDHTTGMPGNSGVTASMVGTTNRTDHTTQVTYHGHPLYTFVKDTKAGDVNGEGVTNFGGTWYVVGADGNAIMTAPAAPAPSPTGSSSSGSGGGYGY